ncbi:hypothetical protein Sjap_001547 [Stephania japonica]|uniref:Uncharacterized protein n=1 Tax=Stephania japonica TaxID=461633 RepID=A0AAP0KMG4_9MAGN
MYQSSYAKLEEAKTSTIADGVAPLSGNPISVIDRQFCAPNATDLVVESKVMSSLTDDSFAVRDVNGNTLFKLKADLSSFRMRRALVDATGRPIVSVQRKLLSTRDR